jgi:hypothetical protein
MMTMYRPEELANANLYSTLTQEELLSELKSCKNDLAEKSFELTGCQIESNKLRDRDQPNQGPSRIYDINARNYTQLGILYNDTSRYPLYGRRKYSRSDKWEYYIIDETRNRLQIPLKPRNDNELFDGDEIMVPILNATLKVQLYDIETYRYY